MGAVNSCCIPQHHGEPQQNGKGHRRNLSATFNLSNQEEDTDTDSQNYVNINLATEEELMTLPGINRPIAKNIVDYRRQIGGFRRVEDLALVSGVGAEKLSRIRCDISIGVRALPGSRDSSLQGSRLDSDSVREQKSNRAATSPQPLINVNTANIFQLIKIKGVGMNLAENIVTYREKNGPFATLDDLAKVKGIGSGILSAIRPYLTVETLPNPPRSGSPPSHLRGNHQMMNGGTCIQGNKGPPIIPVDNVLMLLSDYQRRSISPIENLLEVLGPLAEVPKRPQITKPFKFRHKNRPAVRLASWNLQHCSLDKVSNPGVKDVICMTILENGFGIVAIQELSHDKALEEICQELNEPTLPNVIHWAGHRGTWKCAVSQVAGRMFRSVEYNGFLYDSSQKIELLNADLLDKGDSKGGAFARVPYVGCFRINGELDFVVVSVHLKATGLKGEDAHRTRAEVSSMSHVLKCLSKHVEGEKDVILVGDFNHAPDSKEFDSVRYMGYQNCIAFDTPTNISVNNNDGSKSYDNIWINSKTQSIWTGNAGVVRTGLSSPLIPNGWKWGGMVSNHCPIFVELYADRGSDAGNLGISAEGIRFIVGADS